MMVGPGSSSTQLSSGSVDTLGANREPKPVAFGLSLGLLLAALLPVWLFLAALLPVLAAVWSGVLPEESFYEAIQVTGFVCYAVILPLGAYGFYLVGERRRALVDQRLSPFASRIVELYSVSHRRPGLAEDPRAAQAFRLYILAGEELDKNPREPRQETWAMISRGTHLAEQALDGERRAAATE